MGLQSKVVPDAGEFTTPGLMALGAELKTALAAGKLRLFKSSLATLTGLTADLLDTHEADYDGYVAGGIAVAAVNDPYVDANNSVLVTAPLTQFNFVSAAPTVSTNTIGGAAYEDAAGVIRGAIMFDEPIEMATNDDSIPVVIAWRLGEVPLEE